MKKFNTILTTMLLAFVSFSQANAINVVLEFDKPESCEIKIDGTPIEELVKSRNELNVQESCVLEVTPKGGYVLSSVTRGGQPDGNFNKYTGWTKTITADCEGDTYVVETLLMSEHRNASCWVTVDRASAIRMVRSTSLEEVDDLQDGQEVEVWYNADEELPFTITSATGAPIYKITLNGNKVEGTTSFVVSPTAEHGDIIKITTQYPDVDCNVSFELVNGAENFLTRVTADGVDIAPENLGSFTIKAGKKLTLKGDMRAYKFNGMKVGDAQITDFPSEYSTYITQDTKIVIDVEKLNFDSQMIVYLNVEPTESDAFSFTNNAKAEYKESLHKGYNQIDFSQIQNPFNWSWANDGLAYINNRLIYPDSDASANYTYKTLDSDDIVKLYIGESQESTYTVTFTGDIEAANIMQDIITPVEAAQRVVVLPGTRFTINACDGQQIKVMANGKEITDADGIFTYDVTEDTEFAISDLSSSISVIDADTPITSTIYNILGVKMLAKPLPSGLYIIDGKITLVK